ncbi:MAG: hypothetical protein ACI8PP_002442 [Candidatus Pseudothioglobus sp.]|jgi:hypothetical protein
MTRRWTILRTYETQHYVFDDATDAKPNGNAAYVLAAKRSRDAYFFLAVVTFCR